MDIEEKQSKNILWFQDIDKGDGEFVGGKGANLGEMANHGFPIPPGFCVTVAAYKSFMDNAKLFDKINSMLEFDAHDTGKLDKISAEIRELIIKAKIPEHVEKDIADAYGDMGDVFCAVRSSATAEDLKDASFAGQQDTYLNILGVDSILENVKKCWASLFTSRAIYYRQINNFEHSKVFISVVIQEMVDADVAGVMFTVSPISKDRNEMIIEGSYGLGESVVSGIVTPDTFMVSKDPLEVFDKNIGEKKIMIVKENGKSVKKDVPDTIKEEPSFTDDEAFELAKIGIRIEEHYTMPMDIEWAIVDGEIFITQARPITTL